MPNTIDVQEEIARYERRLEELYDSVIAWVREEVPDAEVSDTTPVELNEQATGPYKVKSLEIAMPGRVPIRLVPRGIFVLGARGRVDVRSRLGREILYWVDYGGVSDSTSSAVSSDSTLDRITRPVYPDVEEGWAWGDESRRRLVHLDENVFRNNVLNSLSE